MASYKQNCIHCNTLIDSDSAYCVGCGSSSPFGYACPKCKHPVEKGQVICGGCGQHLYLACPVCGQRTFTQDTCEACGVRLVIRCPNDRCGREQFFTNEVCTECGKKIKPKYRQITAAKASGQPLR